jgi:hypothetical protein
VVSIVLHLLIVLVFFLAAVPEFFMLMNMKPICSWFVGHGISNFTSIVTLFVVLIMLATGISLSLGLVLASRGEDWYLERQYLWQAKHPGKGEGLNSLENISNALSDSINRLQILSQSMKAQIAILSRISGSVEVHQF